MACNENIIKNIANEVTRECQIQNVNVEPEFVAYLIELLLLNPKYGKLFTKTLNRNALAYFVAECTAMIMRGGTSLNTLKMQFIMRTNYDKVQNLIDKHLDSVDVCLAPLLTEIVDADPDLDDEGAMKKVFRKISIYLIMYSGLGNPAVLINLKESMAALESVMPFEELPELLMLSRPERNQRVQELIALTSGVRLFNRDCRKGGDMIQDLPFDLVDAGNACMSSLSNSLISVMKRVNTLTTAVEDRMVIDEDTENVVIDVPSDSGVTLENYNQICQLLIFNRQYEIYIRRLLNDIQNMVETSRKYVDKYKRALEEIHGTVKYKTAVPVDTVFPLFGNLWSIWRAMQNCMYVVSIVNRLMAILSGIQEHNKIPYTILDMMLVGKTVGTDEERMNACTHMSKLNISMHSNWTPPRASEQIMAEPSKDYTHSSVTLLDEMKHVTFLGFCAMSLNVGALVPSNLRVGFIKHKGAHYGFSNLKLASRFSKDPDRYTNEVLQYARNNPQIINLLNMEKAVRNVKHIEPLVMPHFPKKKLDDKDIQTEVHPLEEYIEHNYTWDLWEWKRRACQWANIVKCQTHSTQTNYSHLRSEIHCQTFEPRDKNVQTNKDVGISTNLCRFFTWGLRGQIGYGQHNMDMVHPHAPEKPKPHKVVRCSWPCDKSEEESTQTDDSAATESDYQPSIKSRQFRYDP